MAETLKWKTAWQWACDLEGAEPKRLMDAVTAGIWMGLPKPPKEEPKPKPKRRIY